MDMAEDGSEDGTSTPTERDADTALPAPTEKDACTIPPAPTGKEAGITAEKPTDPRQTATPKPDRPATHSSESSSSDDDNPEEEEYVSCFLEWLGLNPDCKRMVDNETKMLAHHTRKMGNKAVPIFQQAVNDDRDLLIEARPQVTAALYAMREAIVRFYTRLGIISSVTSSQRRRKADTEGSRRKRVRME